MNCEDTQETIRTNLIPIINRRIEGAEEYHDAYEADLW